MTSVRVNLLPAAYDLRCRRALRLRRWVTAGALVIALQVPAFIVLRSLGTHARELQRGVAQAAAQQQAINAKLQELTKQQQEVNRQLELARQLSSKHRWSELLGRVADCLPETAVLTRIETDPPSSAGPGGAVVQVRSPAAAARSKKDAQADSAAGGLVASGMAVDHDTVAAFLRNLNATERIGSCSLESAMRQPFMKGEAVFFTVKIKW